MKKNQKIVSRQYQQGISLISLVSVIVLSVFVFSSAVKMVPYYLENIKVNSSLASIAEEINDNKIKPQDIKSRLIKRLASNDVSRISDDEIRISGGEQHTTLSIEYEVRTSFVGNIDSVMKFSNSEIINL